MGSSNNEAVADSVEQTQKWSLPKWIEWPLSAVILIYTVFIFLPGMFNSISIAMEKDHASQEQLIQNTVFVVSNLLVSLAILVSLGIAIWLNRRLVHLWRELPAFIIISAFFLGCAYDSLAHLLPNKPIPLLVEVLTQLAPGPMATLNDLKPILQAVMVICVIVNSVRSLRPKR